MDYQLIKQWFPNSFLSPKTHDEQIFYSIPVGHQYLIIPNHEMTSRESAMLEELLKYHKMWTPIPESDWQKYLVGQGPKPKSSHQRLRLIQINISTPHESMAHQVFAETFQTLFSKVVDAFFMSKQLFFLIQGQSSESFSVEDLDPMISAVEDDFSLKISVYVGEFYPYESDLSHIWQEEQEIYEFANQDSRKRVVSLSSVVLHYFAKDALAGSKMMNTLQAEFVDDNEWRETIQALWHSQGNITEAAKALYIHRNTLQYRIDKFYKATHLSLKNMNHLLLSYLLTL